MIIIIHTHTYKYVCIYIFFFFNEKKYITDLKKNFNNFNQLIMLTKLFESTCTYLMYELLPITYKYTLFL